ncbi:MAG: phosphonate C-P lyase system protein PhnH [Thermodesulfobacteriota bacterium]
MTIYNGPLATQQAFRILLQALSHPGEIYPLSPGDPGQGLPLLLYTLLDHEVGFAVIGPDSDSCAGLVRDWTKAHLTEVPGADFIIVTDGCSQGEIRQAKRGTLEYPDRGATIIYLVASLGREEPAGLGIKLQGPGVAQERRLRITGLAADEIFELKKINQEFPLGVDCFFLDRSGRVMGLPRSTQLEVQ